MSGPVRHHIAPHVRVCLADHHLLREKLLKVAPDDAARVRVANALLSTGYVAGNAKALDEYLKMYGIMAERCHGVRRPGIGHPVERARQAVRDAIVSRLAGSAAAGDAGQVRVAGVVAALVTGDQRAIDRADWDVFRATGVAHLMSISGLHITLFAWLAALVVRRLWCRSPRLCLAVPAPSAALVAGVLLAGAYALFSGWGVPAQRTVLMLATIAALQLSGRRWPWPQVWLLACAVVVLRTMLDDTYKSADDIRKYAGMVVLASIPLADAGEQPKEKSEFKRRTKRFANDVRRRVGGSSGRKA